MNFGCCVPTMLCTFFSYLSITLFTSFVSFYSSVCVLRSYGVTVRMCCVSSHSLSSFIDPNKCNNIGRRMMTDGRIVYSMSVYSPRMPFAISSGTLHYLYGAILFEIKSINDKIWYSIQLFNTFIRICRSSLRSAGDYFQ